MRVSRVRVSGEIERGKEDYYLEGVSRVDWPSFAPRPLSLSLSLFLALYASAERARSRRGPTVKASESLTRVSERKEERERDREELEKEEVEATESPPPPPPPSDELLDPPTGNGHVTEFTRGYICRWRGGFHSGSFVSAAWIFFFFFFFFAGNRVLRNMRMMVKGLPAARFRTLMRFSGQWVLRFDVKIMDFSQRWIRRVFF